MHELFNALGTTIVTTEVDKSSCTNLHCGPNSVEEKLLHHTDKCTCVCKPNYVGNPILGCRPGCLLNSHCPVDQACHNFQCTDPCPGTCGQAALCMIINQKPMCFCPNGFSGNPYQGCQKLPQLNDNCKVSKTLKKSQNCMFFPNLLIKNLASVIETAKCQEGYVGQPPYCRPECVLNSDCLSYVSCINGKCQDPCQNGCGENADCKVIRHQAVCSCKENTVGNPYKRCSYDDDEGNEQSDKDQENGGQDGSGHDGGKGHDDNGKKRCRQDYDCQRNQECISGKCQENGGHDEGHGGGQGHDDDENGGRPCRQDYDCKRNQACISGKCQGNGGGNNDTDIDQNTNDFDDDENRGKDKDNGGKDQENDENGNKRCREDYDCKRNQACISGICQEDGGHGGGHDGGQNGGKDHDDTDIDHDFDDDENRGKDKDIGEKDESQDCNGQKCGQYAKCVRRYRHKSCQCLDGYSGTPPFCTPQCRQDYDCNRNQTCKSGKCQDNTNDFDNGGKDQDDKNDKDEETDCNGQKCGQFAKCVQRYRHKSCQCLTGYSGTPPLCTPQCRQNYDCNRNQACISGKCQDSCSGACGLNAKCTVTNHLPRCFCQEGYEGDPYEQCTRNIPPKVPEDQTYQNDTISCPKCGFNAQCEIREEGSSVSCKCMKGYLGDPQTGCRPECILSSECEGNEACLDKRCQDPCASTCGVNAKCSVVNHFAVCTCQESYSGNPFKICTKIDDSTFY